MVFSQKKQTKKNDLTRMVKLTFEPPPYCVNAF